MEVVGRWLGRDLCCGRRVFAPAPLPHSARRCASLRVNEQTSRRRQRQGVDVSLLAYDPGRLQLLRSAIEAALDDLGDLRSDDEAAADAMMAVRNARLTLTERCLPRVVDILNTDPMSTCQSARVDGADVRDARLFAMPNRPGWQVGVDPLVDRTSARNADGQQHRRDEIVCSLTDVGCRSVARAAKPKISSVTRPLTCDDAGLPFLCRVLGFDSHDPLVRTVQMAALVGLGDASL
jgi:hypothetical protein